jgi:phenylalanyl-tRNA synthetase beta chain
VCLFEIDIEKLVPLMDDLRAFRSIARFPSTDRDLALLVDTGVPAQKVHEIVCSFPQVRDATLFDVYQGKQVPAGKKSLAFALRYQSMDRTLTDEEVDRVQRKILARLEKEVGAVLRQ